jgi:hypothetical protein
MSAARRETQDITECCGDQKCGGKLPFRTLAAAGHQNSAKIKQEKINQKTATSARLAQKK